ncbi:MAG: hypothetical protein JRH20_12085 [Deltaproteobacteria bacterium]|nr:hypothetical protein [Deltaproteobacteria bacterium]
MKCPIGSPRKFMGLLITLSIALSFTLSERADANPLRGVLKLPKATERPSPYAIGVFWPNLRNTLLPPAPPLVDIRRDMVVAIEGSGLVEKLGHNPVLVMEDGRFSPPVLAIRPGTTVSFENRDWTLHLIEPTKGKLFKAQSLGPGDTFKHTFPAEGTFEVRCDVVPHMRAKILVSNKAQLSLVDNSGAYHFPDIPPGTYKLRVWYHGKWFHDQAITVRGRTTVNIKLESLPKD